MRMILSEALQDDLVALEAGVWCLLPNLDASGRQILYLDVAHHTLNGYTSESLVSKFVSTIDRVILFLCHGLTIVLLWSLQHSFVRCGTWLR